MPHMPTVVRMSALPNSHEPCPCVRCYTYIHVPARKTYTVCTCAMTISEHLQPSRISITRPVHHRMGPMRCPDSRVPRARHQHHPRPHVSPSHVVSIRFTIVRSMIGICPACPIMELQLVHVHHTVHVRSYSTLGHYCILTLHVTIT